MSRTWPDVSSRLTSLVLCPLSALQGSAKNDDLGAIHFIKSQYYLKPCFPYGISIRKTWTFLLDVLIPDRLLSVCISNSQSQAKYELE